MSRNLNQIPTQATSILSTDKMYIARSPFGVTDDRYILGSDIIAQLASPLTTKGDLYTFSTVDARLPVALGDGKILQVASATAVGLAWSTPTYPSASGTAGRIIISDGTNNVYSTPAYPNTAGTLGSIIISDGTNKINSTSLWPNTVGVANHLVISNGTSNVYSTPAYPNASVTAGKVIISDGTDYIASTSVWPNTVGSVGTIIRSDGTVNTYTTSTFADTYLINTLLFAGAANTIAGATLTSIIDASIGNTQGNILYRNATDWVVLAPGNAGEFLRSGGAGANVSWAAEAGSGTVTNFSAGDLSPLFTTSVANPTTTPALSFTLTNAGANTYFGNPTGGAASPAYTAAGALTRVDDTNVTLTLGGSPTVALLAATSLTLGWTGLLSLLRGGTNANLTASNGGIVWSNATQMQILAGTATAGQMLQSGSTAAPSWSTTTWPATSTAGRLLYSTFNNVIGELTTTADSVLTSTAGGVPQWSLSTSFANAPTNTNITSMTGLTGSLRAPTAIQSSAGVNLLAFNYVGSAVNYISISNNTTGNRPFVSGVGTDTNVDLQLIAQGTGRILSKGTGTNNNVDAGYIGEFIESVIGSGAPVTFTNSTAVNVTSISLTAGDWDVWGNVSLVTAGGGTGCSAIFGYTTTVSATAPDASLYSAISTATSILQAGTGVSVPYRRYSLAATTTIYLGVYATCDTSSGTGCGAIYARRAS